MAKYLIRAEEEEVITWDITANSEEEARQKILHRPKECFSDVAYRGRILQAPRISSFNELAKEAANDQYQGIDSGGYSFFFRTIEISPVYWEVEADSEEEALEKLGTENRPSRYGFIYKLICGPEAISKHEHELELREKGTYCNYIKAKEVNDKDGRS